MAANTSTTLSELVYDILNNTMDAILNAQLDQERRYFEMIEDSILSAEEFVAKYDLKRGVQEGLGQERITDDDLEDLLLDMYEDRRQLMKKMLEDGPPKLRVQEGNINVKLAFAVSESQPAEQDRKSKPTLAKKTKEDLALTAGTIDTSLKGQVKHSLKLQLDNRLQSVQLHRAKSRSVQVALPNSSAENTENGKIWGSLDLRFTVD